MALLGLCLSTTALVIGIHNLSHRAPSMSSRVSDQLDASAVCVKAGVQEIAAKRERVYRCSYDLADAPGRYATPCWAVIDGDLQDVTDEADPAFDCSHVARYKDGTPP